MAAQNNTVKAFIGMNRQALVDDDTVLNENFFNSERDNYENALADVSDTAVKRSGDTLDGDLIGKSFVNTRDGNITRASGYISEVELVGGRTLAITRDIDNYITSITDSIRTWTFTRDGDNFITNWAVT